MATYYIANAGNDSTGDGSIGNPWATIAKVNSLTLSPGDIVYFNCGDRWRETLEVGNSGTSGSYIKFTKYGTGNNPKIIGSTAVTSWTNTSGNIWRSNNTFSTIKSLYPGSCDIYFEYNDNTKERGNYKSTTGGLVAEFDWTESSGYVYVYSTTDPSAAYAYVEIPQRWASIYTEDQEYLHFDGIDVSYSSFAGIDCTTHHDVIDYHGLIIENCEISCVGGITPSQYGYGTNVVYSDMVIRKCLFYYIGRRSISMNMQTEDGNTFIVSNVLIEDNIFKWGSHTTSLDLTCNNTSGGSTGAGSYDGVIFRRNLIEEKQGVSVPYTVNSMWLQAYSGSGYMTNIYIYSNIFKYWRDNCVCMECPTMRNVYVYNNTFYENNSADGYLGYSYGVYADQDSTNFRAYIKNNIFYTTYANDSGGTGALVVMYGLNSTHFICDYNLFYRINNTVRTHLINGTSYYMNTIGSLPNNWEDNCPTPSNPLFVSPTDLHLQSGSPARYVGVSLAGIVDYDYDGLAFAPSRAVGAYEYAGTITPPSVTTTAISDIAETTATGGGNVTYGGGGTVSARGICWSTSINPTILDSHTTDGSGTGVYISNLTSLVEGTHYYVRAYATNEIGTSYGSNVQFDSLGGILGFLIEKFKIHKWSLIPEIEFTFDDIANVPVADASSVSDWNTFFDLPTNGTPFISVSVLGNTVKLHGGSGIKLKKYLFGYEPPHLISINDPYGIIVAIDDTVFTMGMTTASFESFNLPGVITIGDSAFSQFNRATLFILPNAETIGHGCFTINYFTEISLPSAIIIESSCFGSCYYLETISIPKCTSLGSDVIDAGVFSSITGNTITLTVPAALMTCNGGNPHASIAYLQSNNTVTVIQV